MEDGVVFLEQSEKVYCLGQETTTFLGESTKHDDRSSNIFNHSFERFQIIGAWGKVRGWLNGIDISRVSRKSFLAYARAG